MESQLLWFLLAGFILGFAASTLWEWLYFRGRRLAMSGDFPPQAEPREKITSRHESVWTAPAVTETHYRSPAVFLEGEQVRADVQASNEPAVYEPLQPTTPTTQQPLAATEPARPTGQAQDEDYERA